MPQDFTLSPEAIEQLKKYDYPGNVRELRNILFIAATQSKNGEISGGTVEEVMRVHSRSRVRENSVQVLETGVQASPVAAAPAAGNPASLHDLEAQHIASLLKKHNSNRRLVAQELNISERTLYRKLKKYELG